MIVPRQNANSLSDHFARRLAERLDGLPLALATAGAYLERSSWSFERYLEEYEKRWNVNPCAPTRLPEYRDRTLYTTWDLSYHYLQTETPAAARLLKLLAYFDNQTIHYSVFQAEHSIKKPGWRSRVARRFSRPREKLSADSFQFRKLAGTAVEFESLMAVLAQHRFVEAKGEAGFYAMHNCIHDWTLASLNRVLDVQSYMYAFNCVASMISVDDMDMLVHLKYSDLAILATRLTHSRFLEDETLAKAVENRYKDALLVARLLHYQILLQAAEQMYLRALAGHEKALGPKHILTLDTVHHLGSLYQDQGKSDLAESMYMRALVETEKAQGPDHISTLDTVNNLGNLYRDQCKLAEAEQMYKRALVGTEKKRGPNHLSTLYTVYNLGTLYYDQDKLTEAEQMYKRVLAGREKLLDPDHTLTLQTISSFGCLYHRQNKLAEAEQMYKQALAGREKTLGPDHTSTLETVDDLGKVYYDQRKFTDAEQMYKRVLAKYEKMLGRNHSSTLRMVNNLAFLYHDQDRLVEAEQMYKRVLVEREKTLGTDHPSTLRSIKNLGVLYHDHGKVIEAEQMYKRALTGREKVLGPDHSSTRDTARYLNILYRENGMQVETQHA